MATTYSVSASLNPVNEKAGTVTFTETRSSGLPGDNSGVAIPFISSRLFQNRPNATAFPDRGRSRGKSVRYPRCRGGVRCVRAWKSAIDRFPARAAQVPLRHARCCAAALERRDDGAVFAIELVATGQCPPAEGVDTDKPFRHK